MPKSNQMTGGEAVARMLKAFNIGPMFGMGGFQLLPFYDAARRIGLIHNLTNDERCGVFAADSYAKISGRVGVCDATLGPGATNLITGLIESLNSGTPLVVLIGNTNRLHSWKNMTQESHQLEILRPACKELIRIEVIERIPEIIRRAFLIATSGRPGPVVIDIPEDICHGTFHFQTDDFLGDTNLEKVPSHRVRGNHDDLMKAAEKLSISKRPMILCGGGVHISKAYSAIIEFAEAFNIPVAHTMTGKGSIPCVHRLNAGLFGRYDRIANKMILASDCILVIGCKLGEIATKRYSIPDKTQTLIHVEVVAEEFDRTYKSSLRIWADAREALIDLKVALEQIAPTLNKSNLDYAGELKQSMQHWRNSVSNRYNSEEIPIDMARVMHELNQFVPENGILVADGGFAAHWGGLLYDTKKSGRGFVPDRGFASIGYGLPGAIGAALAAAPNQPIFALTGDSGLNMTIGELETAKRMGLAFTLLVINNAASGYVKALQHLLYGKDNYQSSDLVEQNYAQLAKNFGCAGIRVENPENLKGALKSASETEDRPTVIDIVVTRDPSKMLPGVDSRAAQIKAGDRIA